MNSLEWLQTWYLAQCDGDWEHDYGITIKTLDNPGWSVMIELKGTDYSLPDKKWKQIETTEQDWYGYKVENDVFDAAGDPSKLEFLLQLFREQIEGLMK